MQAQIRNVYTHTGQCAKTIYVQSHDHTIQYSFARAPPHNSQNDTAELSSMCVSFLACFGVFLASQAEFT